MLPCFCWQNPAPSAGNRHKRGRTHFRVRPLALFGAALFDGNKLPPAAQSGFGDASDYAEFMCLRYKRGDDRKLVIDEPDAEIVRKMYKMRAGGCSLGAISNWLYESKVPSPTGKPHWSRETISKLLRNEKYVGDVLLQKTFIADLFSRKQVKNQGELERFLIQEHHPAIVSRKLFEAASLTALKRPYG